MIALNTLSADGAKHVSRVAVHRAFVCSFNPYELSQLSPICLYNSKSAVLVESSFSSNLFWNGTCCSMPGVPMMLLYSNTGHTGSELEESSNSSDTF